jgi:hypothetical protein
MSFLKKLFCTAPSPDPVVIEGVGLVSWVEGAWRGIKELSEGRSIQFVLDGTPDGPNSRLKERLTSDLQNWDAIADLVSEEIERFLTDCGVNEDLEEFSFEYISYLWPDTPDHFVVDVTWAKDPDRDWHVEFIDGKPVPL